MAEGPRKPLFPNPFYAFLLVASTAFAVTALAYFVSPNIAIKARAGGPGAPDAGSLALAAWFDRHGPLALGVEFLLMLASGLLAMATDRWFAPSKGRSKPGHG